MKLKGAFHDWLKERRKALDLTQRELADQVGCAEVTIRKIESGTDRPSKQIAERMADVLAIALDERAAFARFARRLPERPPALPIELGSQRPDHNLLSPPTPFIGREDELARLASYFAQPDCRLLTLLGPGGIGKSRLALQAAAKRREEFADGVYFVPLTPVGSTRLIADAIANVLKLPFYGEQNPEAYAVNYLRSKHLLLILDNFEHLLDGVELLTDILKNAPRVKILVTSRERLNVQEEWIFPVEGLPFPLQDTDEAVASYSAVQLFVQSVRRVQPGFALEGNQHAVIAICQAVEGMPLGLELAAAWLRAMPCQQIAEQIRHDLDFLSTPLRNVPDRHRSLRALFDHSWNLLSPIERDVMMYLSVFRGGWDIEAAEQVASAALPRLAGLVDKSLIRPDPAGRYSMHELVRQYAASQLRDSGKEDAAIRCHCDYFLKLAESADAHAFGREQIAWFDRLEIEQDNLRAAFARSAATETGLQLAAALGWFFSERCHLMEGRTWLEQALAANPAAPASLRAMALQRTVTLAGTLGDARQARSLGEQALALARAVNDHWNMAWSLSHLGLFLDTEPDQSAALLEESLALFRELGDPMGLAHTLNRRFFFAFAQGNYPYARVLVEEAAILAQQAGDTVMMAWTNYGLGRLAYSQDHDLRQARDYFERAATLFHKARFADHFSTFFWAEMERALGNVQRAQVLYQDYLSRVRWGASSNEAAIPTILVELASIARASRLSERAAVLLGAVGSKASFSIFAFLDTLENTYDEDVAAVRSQLGEAAFAEAWAAGQAMTPEQAIAYALEEDNAAMMHSTGI